MAGARGNRCIRNDRAAHRFAQLSWAPVGSRIRAELLERAGAPTFVAAHITRTRMQSHTLEARDCPSLDAPRRWGRTNALAKPLNYLGFPYLSDNRSWPHSLRTDRGPAIGDRMSASDRSQLPAPGWDDQAPGRSQTNANVARLSISDGSRERDPLRRQTNPAVPGCPGSRSPRHASEPPDLSPACSVEQPLMSS